MTTLFAGLSTIDIAYRVGSYPPEDSKTQAIDQFIGAGGPATNAAVAYAALGGAATLVTPVGTNVLSDIIRNDLVTHRVKLVDALPRSSHRPPVSSIVVSESAATRTVVSLDGSRIRADFDPALCAYLADIRTLLVDGHYPAIAIELCKRAAELGVRVVLDAGRWKDAHTDILPYVHTAICSSTFAPPAVDSGKLDDLFDFLGSVGVVDVAVTNGDQPIVGLSGGTVFEVEVEKVEAIDTLGAGDVLHGAFCFFNDEGQDFVDALTSASKVATFSCQYFGTRQWRDHISDLKL
ncbi:PfkB family carbohydrate kinase [Nocardia cyriacigeorgica]|uniref:PfkB family carbohydrate kinase n=1 Tax=Nocardia cyriacigeorgica TaxID=135487 RepID=UPI0024581A46|nr:PfkB family carbohydrate kinase [Nocardia cyriacigeorgica]